MAFESPNVLGNNVFKVTVSFIVRADNWLVDTGSEPSEHNGLSPFGKVSEQSGML